MELTPRTSRDEWNLLMRGQKRRCHGIENYSSLFVELVTENKIFRPWISVETVSKFRVVRLRIPKSLVTKLCGL